ncbi:MAG: DUF3048 domain-containing protein [Anaerolineales bacterium]|nr:DUF3048 domain-containing protein [Anaerolineales bacterium]
MFVLVWQRVRTGAMFIAAGLTLSACAGPPPLALPTPVIILNSPAAALTAAPPTPEAATAAPVVTTATAPIAPTDIPLYGPDTYPDNINPLTGEQVDPAKLNRIPLALKITNFPLSARPQWGLSLADIVVEHLTEAGLTRFTAIYLQHDVAKVGPVRSARYVDAEIAPMFQAALVTSGSSFGTMDKLRRSAWLGGANGWRLVSEESAFNCPPLCREAPNDINSLFVNTDSVRQALASKTTQGLGKPELSGLAFSAAAPAGGQPATELNIRFSGAAQVAWRYNPDTGRYNRWHETGPGGDLIMHVDALTNVPITAANVVLLSVSHVNNLVPEDFLDGGNCGVEIQIWTSGPARVFRDGQVIEGRWQRDQTTNMRLRLYDHAGHIISLKPGNTWFDIVTLNSVLSLENGVFAVINKVPDTRSFCLPPPTPTPEGLLPVETPTPGP